MNLNLNFIFVFGFNFCFYFNFFCSCMIKSLPLWCHQHEHHPAMQYYVVAMSSISSFQRLATRPTVSETNCYSCCHSHMYRWAEISLFLFSFRDNRISENTVDNRHLFAKNRISIYNEKSITNNTKIREKIDLRPTIYRSLPSEEGCTLLSLYLV